MQLNALWELQAGTKPRGDFQGNKTKRIGIASKGKAKTLMIYRLLSKKRKRK